MITINLVEKLLNIYSSIYLIPKQHKSNSQLNAFHQSLTFLTQAQLQSFLMAIGLWIINQTFIAGNILSQFQIIGNELNAIRHAFSMYDVHFTNEMNSNDLYFFLQDLGEEYNPIEIKLILLQLDADNLGLIEFTEFIKWWCEE